LLKFSTSGFFAFGGDQRDLSQPDGSPTAARIKCGFGRSARNRNQRDRFVKFRNDATRFTPALETRTYLRQKKKEDRQGKCPLIVFGRRFALTGWQRYLELSMFPEFVVLPFEPGTCRLNPQSNL
jgi:hypothetical protein